MNTTLPSRSNPVLETSPAKSGALYIPQDRRTLLALLAGVVGVAIVVLAVVLLYQQRSAKADLAFGEAMRTLETPVIAPGQPAPAGEKTFSSTEERARAANAQFAAVADTYGMTTSGRNAKYLQGVTALQMGQNSTAEQLLKSSADSWNRDIASLAKLSLASLYHGTGRDADAISIYQNLTEKPTTAVPAGLAQLQLADLYNSEGKKDQARKIYAQIKDKDPKSAAAEIATQNLGETPGR